MDKHDLRDWALENEIHEDVYNFLLKYGSLSEYGMIYVNKFDWKKVSTLLAGSSLEDGQDDIRKILGQVGYAHFAEYLRNVSTVFFMTSQEEILSQNYSHSEIVTLIDVMTTELRTRLQLVQNSWGSEYLSSDAFVNWQKSVTNVIRKFDLCRIEYKFMLHNSLAFDDPDVTKALHDNVAFAKLNNEIRTFI